jgi:hypothetical protein
MPTNSHWHTPEYAPRPDDVRAKAERPAAAPWVLVTYIASGRTSAFLFA